MNEKEAEIEKDDAMSTWKERLKQHIPILQWLPQYKKMDLIADMIAGLTVGLTLIPQSVAYAGLAGLSPEYGLYSSFMGSFIYVVFGTIKEVSVGPTSLISLLTFEFTKDLPVDFVFLLTFMCGCVEFLLGLLQFGFLVNFISVPVTTSFQSATSLIIISSQLKDLLGVSKFKSGRFLSNILAVVNRIKETRTGDLALSVFCCIFLLLLRKLKDVDVPTNKKLTGNKKLLKKTLWFISISRNAICVLISCILAYVFSLYGLSPFKLAGNIPSGIPTIRSPKFSIQNGNNTFTYTEALYEISSGILVIPLISILANVTIAKAFSAGSVVKATQEMITLGMCNMSGSFVGSMPTCGAFTRSAVSNSSGVRTPLAGLFTGTLIILVIKFLTPYFYYIPRASLASVLVCAVIFMIDWKTTLLLWKVNRKYQPIILILVDVMLSSWTRMSSTFSQNSHKKNPQKIYARNITLNWKMIIFLLFISETDFLCSIITFSVCLVLGIQTGLLCGIIVNTGHLLYLWARPSILVQVKTTNEGSYYKVTPDIGLYFPATDFLRNTISSRCVENIPIVIDCLHFKGIDYTTAWAIKELGHHCKKRGQKLIFFNMSINIYNLLKNSNVDICLKQCNCQDDDLNNILFYSEKELLAVVRLDSESNLNSQGNPEGKPLLKE